MMQAMTSFGEVLQSVANRAANYHDEAVNIDEVSFSSLYEVSLGTQRFELQELAAKGLAAKLGVPFQYLDKCNADLQASNLNYWIEKMKGRDNKAMFRFDGEKVRAVMSPRFVPIDNVTIVRELASLGIAEEAQVQSAIDEQFFLLSIPSPSKAFRIGKRKDEHYPGISIGNSEVGLASFTVSAFILRLICTNGLISTERIGKTSYRHISKRFLDEMPSILKSASEGIIDMSQQLDGAYAITIENPEERLQQINTHHMLNEYQRKAVAEAWPLEAGDKLFNIIQTYTRAAQYEQLKAVERHRLQTLAGELLSSQ